MQGLVAAPLRICSFQTRALPKFYIMCQQDPETLVTHLFEGAMQSTVECGKCGAESSKLDAFQSMDLSLEGCASLVESLKKLLATEQLPPSFRCDHCKEMCVTLGSVD